MNGSVVRLGDVAEIATADRRAGAAVGRAAADAGAGAGTQRFLRKREIEDLLAAHGVDLQELRFDGAAQVTIVAAERWPAESRRRKR